MISPKEAYATTRLIEEARAAGVAITAMDVHELAAAGYKVDVAAFDALYIRQAYLETSKKIDAAALQWVQDLARQFAGAGKVVVDSALAQNGLGGGKLEVYRALEAAGVLVPQTEPLSNPNKEKIKFPVVAKWNFGFGAQHVYYIDSPERLAEVASRYPAAELLIQDFVAAPFEYKYVVVGYKALPVAVRYVIDPQKHVPDLKDFKTMDTAALSELTTMMERAAKVTARELCKIDVLQDASGRFHVLEVNRWPGLRPFEEASGFNVAREFVGYIRGKVL